MVSILSSKRFVILFVKIRLESAFEVKKKQKKQIVFLILRENTICMKIQKNKAGQQKNRLPEGRRLPGD